MARRYAKSRSDAQLRGAEQAPNSLDACQPQLFQGGNQSAVIEPCGLVAWSLFNDTFQARGWPVHSFQRPLCCLAR